MEPIELPKYIDEPPTVLLWQIDEVVPLVIGVVLGIMLGQALIFSVLSLIATHYYRRYLDASQDGFLIHYLYWHGLSFNKAKSFPNAFIRVFV